MIPERRPARDERGAVGALLTTGICLALAGVFFAASVLIGWFAQARHAEQAAELAALAAASAAVEGKQPCPAATSVALGNRATVAACQVRGSGRRVVVEVTVLVRLTPAFPGGPTELRRVATAGSG